MSKLWPVIMIDSGAILVNYCEYILIFICHKADNMYLGSAKTIGK